MKLAPALAAALLLALAGPALTQTIPELQAKANAGDRQSQFVLGEAYRTGQGVIADRDLAIAWFRKAASQGDARAADAMGMLLFTKGERREAIPLLEAAETREDARALYLLGTARFNGDGVTKDLPRAYAEMRAAADMGLPQAIRSLQLMETYISDKDRLASQSIRPTRMAASTIAAAAPLRSPEPAPVAATYAPAPVAAAPASVVTLPPSAASGATAAPSAPTPLRTTELPPSARAPAVVVRTAPPPPPPKPRPAPAPATGKWRVQLGAIVTQARAEEQWRTLAKKVPQLSRLPHVTVQAGAIWRLQATGLASLSETKDLCKAVTAKGGDCIPLSPAP
jgi:hypothetical protein